MQWRAIHWKRMAGRVALALIGAAAVTFAVDDLSLRLRDRPGLDVRIERYLVIAEKFNKYSYERTSAVTERCVYALFPHGGQSPCWYLTTHTLRFVKIGS